MSDAVLRVLVAIDDDEGRALVARLLDSGGISVEIAQAEDFLAAQRALLTTPVGCVVVSARLAGGDAVDLLELAARAGVEAPMIVVSESGDEGRGVEAVSHGAADHVRRADLTVKGLETSVRHALRLRDLTVRERVAEAARERRSAQLERLAQASMRIHAANGVGDTLEAITREAQRLVGCLVAVGKFRPPALDPTRSAPDQTARSAPDQTPRSAPDPIVRVAYGLDDHDLVEASRDAILESLALIAPNTEAGVLLVATELGQVDGVELGSAISVPLLSRDALPIGSIHAVSAADWEIDHADAAVLLQLARLGSISLESEVARAQAATATRDREDVLLRFVEDVRPALGAAVTTANAFRHALATKGAAAPEELLDRALRGAAVVEQTIDDIIDAARIDNGCLVVGLRREPARLLVADAIEAAKPRAHAQGWTLRALGIEDVDVSADSPRIAHVFATIFERAIGSAPQGTLSVSAVKIGRQVCFTVEDNVRNASASTLFQRPRRVRGETPARDQLGLFVARGIVLAHGGTMRAETDTRGTRIEFTLPFLAAP